MKHTYGDWSITPTESSVHFERHFTFETREAADVFIQSTGNYMSSPHISVWIKRLAGSNDVLATIRTADDPFTLVSAGMITTEVDGFYGHAQELAELQGSFL